MKAKEALTHWMECNGATKEEAIEALLQFIQNWASWAMAGSDGTGALRAFFSSTSVESLRDNMSASDYREVDDQPVPKWFRDHVDYYVRTHRNPGGNFFTAMLENDLVKAVCQADTYNFRAIRAMARHLYNHAPSQAWGSKEKVKAWQAFPVKCESKEKPSQEGERDSLPVPRTEWWVEVYLTEMLCGVISHSYKFQVREAARKFAEDLLRGALPVCIPGVDPSGSLWVPLSQVACLQLMRVEVTADE